MCPACISNAAVLAVAAGSTGGLLSVCIGRFRKGFQSGCLALFRKVKEKEK
jgi:hypothetical protein